MQARTSQSRDSSKGTPVPAQAGRSAAVTPTLGLGNQTLQRLLHSRRQIQRRSSTPPPAAPPGPRFPLLLGIDRTNCGSGPDFGSGSRPTAYPSAAPVAEPILRTAAGYPFTPRTAIPTADLIRVFASSVPDGLAFLAGAEGTAAIARFLAGSGATHRFTPSSFMGRRARASAEFASALSTTRGLIEPQLTRLAAAGGGAIDVRLVHLPHPPRPFWPKSHVLTEPQLAAVIGGTQGVEIQATSFSHDTRRRSYSMGLRFIVCDDFGLSPADLYSPALYAFWTLQYERPGNAPYVHELEIDASISGSY